MQDGDRVAELEAHVDMTNAAKVKGHIHWVAAPAKGKVHTVALLLCVFLFVGFVC